MDEVKQEYIDICGPQIEDASSQEKKQLIKQALQFDKYVKNYQLENPCEKEHKYYNPAIQAYCNELKWDNGWHPVDKTDVRTAYPEFIPTDSAIETIKEHGEILEIGAGAGYWAHVLSEAGCEIMPTDMLPTDVEQPEDSSFWKNIGTGKNNLISLPRTGVHSVNQAKWSDDISEDEYPNIPWCEVEIADHSIVDEFPDKTIMICHPVIEKWTEDMLNRINPNQKFIFIGRWYPSNNAMPKFFEELTTWDLLDRFPVYDWGNMHAQGYVFQKV